MYDKYSTYKQKHMLKMTAFLNAFDQHNQKM